MKGFRSIVAATAISVSAVGAMADTVSYSTPVSIDAFTSLNPQLQQFDSTLGTLTGVTVTLSKLMVTPIASVTNISSVPVAYSDAWTGTNPADEPGGHGIGSDSPFTLTDPYDSSNSVSTNYAFDAGSGIAAAVISPSSFAVTNITDTQSFSLTDLLSNVPAAQIGNYIGGGDYGPTYATNEILTSLGTPGFPLFYGSDWDLAGTATVTYTYTPSVNSATVPLPASAISGLVLMGAMAIRKRRAM